MDAGRAAAEPPGDRRELVVLAHGMGRTPASMWWLARTQRAEGYRVLNWAETRLDGARGHILVPSGHTFIMLRRDVHRLVLSFLRSGCFAA